MRRALLLPAWGILVTLGASAQTAAPDSNTVSEPEFANVFFRLDAGKLIPLERQAVTNFRTKASGFMVVHAKSVWEFPDAKSPVRLGKGTLEFVVRMPAQMDPDGMYHLRKLDCKKKTREMVLATARATPLGASSAAQIDDALPVTFTRYGTSSVKMTVTGLPPGEYAIQPASLQAVFCFGVD
jgi:hypothetical protein